jgi:hypothetical protein
MEILSFRVLAFMAEDPAAAYLAAFGLVVIGAIIGGLGDRSDRRLRRLPFFALSALVLLGLSLSQAIWFLFPQALVGGWTWLLLLANAAAACLAGFLLFRLARARSRDAYGHAGMAFLALIPVAFLWLLLKRPRDEDSTPHAIDGGMALAIGLVANVLAGVTDRQLADAINRHAETYVTTHPEVETALLALTAAGQGLEKTLAELAASVATPIRIDDITTLHSIDAMGKGLVRTFVVETAGPVDTDLLFKDVRNYHCTEYTALLDAGATFKDIYRTQHGRTLGDVTTNMADCAP